MYVYIQLYIGRHGSCAAVGVVALGDIAEGERLALIPRVALLNCSNSCVHKVVKGDKLFQTQLPEMSSWVPLLIALLAEYSQKVLVRFLSELFPLSLYTCATFEHIA